MNMTILNKTEARRSTNKNLRSGLKFTLLPSINFVDIVNSKQGMICALIFSHIDDS